MRGPLFDRFLTGTAFVLFLAAAPSAALAAPADRPADQTAVSESSDVLAPTGPDLVPMTASTPAKTPEQKPETTPEATPATTTKTAPGTTPETTPATTTETAPASTPETSPPTTAEKAPATTPDKTPATAAETAPATSPEKTPATTNETAPETTVATATPTPELTPAEINAAIPMPEAAKVAPVTVKDLLASPAKDIDPIDQPIAEKLRELVKGKLGRFADRRDDRTAVEAFYAARSFSPVWIEKGVATARAKAAIARIQAADQDGLRPSDYPTPDFAAAATPEALAEAELKLTDAVLTYARHAQVGPVHFTRVSGDIFYKQDVPEPASILAKVATAKDVAAALDSYNPQQAGYKALKAKLAELRKGSSEEKDKPKVVRIPDGPLLRPGDKSSRVALLRKRLNVTGEDASDVYDKALVEAVKNFQKDKDLSPDGVVGPNTLAVLNGKAPRGNAVDMVIVNMLRWRWLPRQLGEPKLGNAYVMLNIPDFTLKVVQHGKTVWHTKVVTGKPSTPTPTLSETMKFITVNPVWNVPPSIVYNEYLPALQQDPTVMSRMGIRVSQERDGSVHMYMPPGDNNALGRIRFNFPNKFLVYQHDTPDKYLFKKVARAYSHGCMRVENPLMYGEVLLSIVLPKEGYTAAKLRRMYGPSELNINFPTPIPVHITYQTAFVDDAGKLQLRDDVYGRDGRMLAILKGGDRRVADIPIERPAQSYARPPVTLPYGVLTTGGGGYSGPSFFEQLFGIGRPTPPRGVREGRAYRR